MRKLQPVSLLFNAVLFCILLYGTCTSSSAQNHVEGEVADFEILVETKGKGFKLTCKSGCAWQTLRFKSNMHQSQAIDHNGMTSLPRTHFLLAKELKNFLFTIERNENGVSLHGLAGTAWIDLGFSCRKNKCHQLIDEMGMVPQK